MPRTGPRRQATALRLLPTGLDRVDELAMAEGLTIRDGEANRSEMLRLLIERGLASWRPGWRPKTDSV